MPHPGEVTGVREGTISLPDWNVHSGYTEGISLGRYRRAIAPRELGAIAQAPFFREAFSGGGASRKAFREK